MIKLDELFFKSTKRKKIKKQSRTETPRPLEVQSPGGLIIQIGRNHRQNDWISLQRSKPGDVWFHAQECPGSHVVLKCSEGLAEDPDFELAADLAAYFSRAKLNKKVPVVMVPTTFLNRVKGAPTGTVCYREAKVVWGLYELKVSVLFHDHHEELYLSFSKYHIF